ncbi:hypothetical protein ACFPM0_30635 [Pseudonocardia sulfidoxydans]|uniref:hypothetical protein n=1 Tax=Pseudonocardia sulfidoxydans TaxID=54011 RepID=UPI003615D853
MSVARVAGGPRTAITNSHHEQQGSSRMRRRSAQPARLSLRGPPPSEAQITRPRRPDRVQGAAAERQTISTRSPTCRYS